MIMEPDEGDTLLAELHETRAELLASHGGSLSALVAELRRKQDEADRTVVQRLNPAPEKRQAS